MHADRQNLLNGLLGQEAFALLLQKHQVHLQAGNITLAITAQQLDNLSLLTRLTQLELAAGNAIECMSPCGFPRSITSLICLQELHLIAGGPSSSHPDAEPSPVSEVAQTWLAAGGLSRLTALSKLVYLNLSPFMEAVCQLPILQLFVMRPCRLHVPSHFSKLTSLQDLWLIGSISGQLAELSQLTGLTSLMLTCEQSTDLSATNIQSLQYGLAELYGLRMLQLSMHWDHMFEVSPLCNLSSLTNLNGSA